jgi:hypothetical protein
MGRTCRQADVQIKASRQADRAEQPDNHVVGQSGSRQKSDSQAVKPSSRQAVRHADRPRMQSMQAAGRQLAGSWQADWRNRTAGQGDSWKHEDR